MAKARNTLKGVERSRANLTPGAKGGEIIVDYQGMRQLATALTVVVNTDLPKNLQNSHIRKLGVLTSYARQNFEMEIRRPQEQGRRGHARQTGNFTFGARGGGAFVGVNIAEENNNIYGFGYPNVPNADRRTNYVWRALEFGLRPNPRAISDPFAPRGTHLIPRKFFFRPHTGPGVFTPLQGPAQNTGTLIGPKGRPVARVRAPGFAPKLFITRAFNRVVEEMPAEYEKVVAQTFKDFH